MKFEQKIPETTHKRKVSLSLFDKNRTKEMDAIYPVRQIDEAGRVVTVVKNSVGFPRKEYSYYLGVTQYDLMNLTSKEQSDLTEAYSHFHKSYRTSIKEVFLAFPENNIAQQEFIQEFMEKETDNQKLRLQQKELDKLRYLETLVKYTSFIQIFAPSLSSLEEKLKEIRKSAKSIFPSVEKLKKDEVKLLLGLYNNGVQAIKRHSQRVQTPSENLDLAITSPQGGMAFEAPTYYVQGARFRGTVIIESLPSDIPSWWLSNITARQGADIVTVDSKYDEKYDPSRSINSTITSYQKLIKATNDPTDIQKYENEIAYLLGLSERISEGEIIKNVRIHIHVSAFSEEEFGNKIKNLTDELYSKKFISTIVVNNTRNDYQSFFISYDGQEFSDSNVNIGKLRLPTEAIAEGFHHGNITLNDEMGFYIGQTLTGGSMYFNNFTKTGRRLSYSMFVSGVMGAGKTAFLKKLMLNHFLTNGKIFGYDVNGEFRDLVKLLKGTYIPLDGRAGIINFLQVFPFVTVEDETSMEIDIEGSFESHLDSLVDRLRVIRQFDGDIGGEIRGILLDFYINYGLWRNPNVPDITALENEAYPTFDDLAAYVKEQFEATKDELDSQLYAAYEKLIGITRQIQKQHASLLIGHTTLDQSINNDVVFFDISRLKEGKANIYDAVFQASLSLILGMANKYGRAEKRAYDLGEKSWHSLTRVMITIAESHNILNPEKYYNVSVFDILSRESRKFFTGYVLDTQVMEGMLPAELPNNLSDEATFAMMKLKNIIGLTQYKLLGKQSTTSLETLEKYFKDDLKPRDFSEMGKYEISEQGARMKMIISGDRTIDFHAQLSKEELALFRGGA